MSRPANRMPPRAAEPRKRCTRGFGGQSCKKRTCEVCGVVWARDWRRVLFEALKAPGVPVVLSAVTPPGAKELPWDGGTASTSGRIGIALGSGVGSRARRWQRGRGTSRSGGSGFTTAARNACKREMGRCLPLATRAWEPQARGPGHVHPVFHVYSPERRRGRRSATSGTWLGLARGTDSGSWARSGARACSSCRATGRPRTCRATSSVGRVRRRRCRRTRAIRTCRGC